MNKLFTKIATACVGLAMAVGVGVAVGSNSGVLRANASESISFSGGKSSGSGASLTITWEDSNLRIYQEKNTSSNNVNSSYISSPRWYVGHKITFTPLNDAEISKVVFTATSSSYKLSSDCTFTNASASVSGNVTTITPTDGTSAFTVVIVGSQARPSSLTYDIAGAAPFVPEHDGDSANPYSVADARGVIDSGTGLTGKYAKGIVSEIVYTYTANNGVTFNFVDKAGDTDYLQAYKCKNTSGPALTSVEVGDTVVVSGDLTKYGSTYEFGTGCTLVSRVGRPITALAIDATGSKTSYNVDEEFDSTGIVVTGTVGGESVEIPSTDYSVSSPDMTTEGQKTITVTYTGSRFSHENPITGTYNINVVLPSADETIALIDAIGTVVYTQESYDKIVAARAAYTALPSAAKANVTNIQTLEDAEDAWDGLVLTNVNNVETLINNIGQVSLSSGTSITNAENAYNALLDGDLGKSLVSNYSTLTTARSTYDQMVTDNNAAENVRSLITALPSASDITDYSHHADIVAARAAYTALTATQKSLIDSSYLTKLEACEEKDAEFAPKTITIQHHESTTTNMSGNNDANTFFGLDDTIWSVTSTKNDSNNHVGLNKDGTMRLYASSGNGVTLTVSALDNTYTIETVIFTFGSTVGDYEVANSSNTLVADEGVYTVNDKVFTIQNVTSGSNTQVYIESIEVAYSIEESTSADDFLAAVAAIPSVSNINASNLETVNGLISVAENEYSKLAPELLTDDDVVSAKSILDAAKAKATDVGYEVEAADTVAAIAALPDPAEITDYSHHADIVAARTLYEGLSSEAKSKVTNYSKLQACEAADLEYEPEAFDIDTDGGAAHASSNSTAGTAANTAELLEGAYPVNSSLIEWKGGTTAYSGNNLALRIGSGSATGSLTLGFTHNRHYATSVTLDLYSWSGKDVTLSVNGVEKSVTGYTAALVFDLTGEDFSNEITISTTADGTEKRVTIYGINIAYAYRADYSAAKTFEEDYILNPSGNNIPYPESTPTNIPGTSCLSTEEGGLGYYDNAIARYNSNEFGDAARLEFATHTDFANARERLTAWALANGEVITFNTTTGAIQVSGKINNALISTPVETNTAAMIAIISIIGVTAIGGYFLLRKKKER